MKWEDVLKSVVWPILGTILGIGLASTRSEYGDQNVLMAILMILVMTLGLITFFTSKANALLSSGFLTEMGKLYNRLSMLELAVKNTGAFDWIFSRDQLMTIEREKTASCREIWIITPDLSTDTGDSPWTETVKENASQGIVYRYICAETNGAKAAASQLGNTFRLYQDKCYVAMVTQDEYERFPNHHIVIYDPNNQSGGTESFAELETDRKGFWIRLPAFRRRQVIDKSRVILENAKPIKSYMH